MNLSRGISVGIGSAYIEARPAEQRPAELRLRISAGGQSMELSAPDAADFLAAVAAFVRAATATGRDV